MLKSVVETKCNSSDFFSSIFAPVAGELKQVEAMLRDSLSSQSDDVNQLLSMCHRLTGKRLRPALLLLFGRLVGQMNSDLIRLAVSIEMIHTATLVHDDILDGAEQRRHASTINHSHGNQAAVLTGDYLFSKAFFIASCLESPMAAREIGRTTSRVCEGEIRQIGTQERFELGESDYLEIIDAKTGQLCRCACQLGVSAAGGSESQVAAAEEYGLQLGIAFQIIDDLLDIEGDESQTGKSLGTDLEQRKPTLPWIHLVNHASPDLRKEIRLRFDENDIPPDLLVEWLKLHGSLEYSRQKAEAYVDRAVKVLDEFPASPQKRVLVDIAEFVVRRNR